MYSGSASFIISAEAKGIIERKESSRELFPATLSLDYYFDLSWSLQDALRLKQNAGLFFSFLHWLYCIHVFGWECYKIGCRPTCRVEFWLHVFRLRLRCAQLRSWCHMFRSMYVYVCGSWTMSRSRRYVDRYCIVIRESLVRLPAARPRPPGL